MKSLNLYDVFTNLGECYFSSHQHQKAIQTWLQTREIFEPIAKDFPQYDMGIHLSISKGYLKVNQLDSTKYYLKTAKRIWEDF